MSRSRELVLLAATMVTFWPAPAQAETPQERRRRELLEEIGLKPEKPSQKASKEASKAAGEATPPPPGAEPVEDLAPSTKEGARTAAPVPPSFRRTIHPALLQTCRACHVAGGPAGTTRLVLSGDPATDHRTVHLFVDAGDPSASALLTKAAGQAHGGGALWPRGSVTTARVTAWITAGARLDGGTRAPVEPPPGPAPAPAAPRVVRPVERSGATPGPAALPANESPPARNAVSAAEPRAGDADPSRAVHALLMEKCGSCHRAGMPAAVTRFVLSGMMGADLDAATALVDREAVPRSPLLTKAAGELHGGGVVLNPDRDEYRRLLGWAATLGAAKPAGETTPAVPESAGESLPPPAGPASPPSGPAPPAPPALRTATAPGQLARHGLGLPYGFQLNGRFDLNYERRAFSTDPTASGAANALRSYHRLLILSRQSPEERVGLSVEMLGLLFWEANLRFRPRDRWQVVVAAGKIVVPFGADPLMHQSYGGLAGFDQRLLPSLWASEGAAVHLVIRRGTLTVTDDLYVVRGHALRRADAVLSLRSDLSPDDDARLAVGTRAGVAWGPVSVWYSALFNPLGYGRRLFMQAADVTVWRARDLPVLRYVSIGAGLMRADVSGAGAGDDYYHFGSYFQLRIHPREWIYLQYRQGVMTFDNRRGTIVDRTRLTAEDASAHNVGVVVRRGGLSAGLFWFVNLEAVEVPNDLLRAGVTYEF